MPAFLDFVILVFKALVRVGQFPSSAGDMISNGDIVFKRGVRSTHTGDVTAVGGITEFVEVEEEPMPMLNSEAGGDDVRVPTDGTERLAPGAYGKVRVRKNSTLELSSGEYFMKSFPEEPKIN